VIKIRYILVILCFSSIFVQAQNERKVIQFSGVIVTETEDEKIAPLPYTTVGISGTRRGTTSEIDGFFSLVAQTGDTIVFRRVGFQTVEKVIPDTLSQTFYSWYQVMSQDSVLLPEAVIYPWPSKEHYKLEFLAMDVEQELRALAEANLAEQLLESMRLDLRPDGQEAFDYTNARQLQEYKYTGQYKPQNIFNPIAWAQFIKAWQRGDFKRKKKDK